MARGGGGGGGGRGPAVAVDAAARAAAAAPVQLLGRRRQRVLPGHVYDKNPNQVAPKTLHRQGRDQDRREEADLRERQQQRVRARLDGPRRRREAVHRRAREPDRRAAELPARRRPPHAAHEEHRLHAGSDQRAKIERFTVERPDGFKFRVKVTLPADYQAGTRLPALFWFYPREFATQEEYDRPDRTFNKNTFPNFGARSMEFFARLGYAVVEPDAPIVGPQGQMNNNYVNDLRNNLAATIDELDRRGSWSIASGSRSAATATARSRRSTRWCTRRSSRRASRATAPTTAR